jgi:hypothetical protein
MTKFTDQLFADLMHEHGATLANIRPPAAPKRHVAARRTLLAAGAGCTVAAAVAGTLVAGGGTPAYAVTKNPDGTLTLAVYQASGIAGANARLHQLGDQVVVVPVGPGCPALGSLPAPAVPPNGEIRVQGSGSNNGPITVNAEGIPAGDILVIGVETSATGTLMGSRLTSPPAPACVSLTPPPGGIIGPGPSGAQHGHVAGPGSSRVQSGGGSGPSLSGSRQG